MPGTRRAATSFAQDGLWYLEQLAPGSPAPTVCRTWEVSGPLDVGALRAAWYELVRRHEILRAALVTEGGQPVLQVSGHPARRSFTEIAGPVPGAAATAATATAAAERLFAELGSAPMALAQEPLARLTVASLAGHRHLVAMELHRGVADDRSAAILVSELSACYAAAVSGRPPGSALRAPITQYTDYTSWQREQAGTPRYQDLRQWWTAALTPPPPPLALPADRAAPQEPSWRGGTVRFGWGEDISRLLTHRCRDQATQPWVLLLTAFQCVLRRYSGQDRVPVGMPVTAPVPTELAQTVGPLDNIVMLCTDLGGRPTFREAAARAHRSAADALDRSELPFALLIRDLNLNRDPCLMPMCDAMFVAHEVAEPELTLPGTAVIRRDVDSAAVHADLTLTMTGSTGSLGFRDSRFRNASALRVAEQIRTLFVAALRSPDQPVDTLAMDGQDRIRTTVRIADQISGAVPAEHPVHELVHQQARRRPDAVAVAYADTAATYRELERHATAITRALSSAGAVAGQPVAVRTATGPWHVAALLGVLDAGAHVVCLSAGDVGARGRAILAGLRPAWLVVDGAAAGSELASWYTGELGGQVLDVSQLLEGAQGADAGDALTDSPQAARRMLGELAYVAFTSGSTGSPKGIPQFHETLSQFVTWFSGEFGIGQASRVAQWAAPGYDASLCEVFATLTAGATLCPVPDKIRANPEKLVTWLAAERITVLQTVPSFAKNLLKVIADRSAARELTRLNHLLLAGEALPGELANELRATLPWTRLINLYGSTETILATWHEVGGPATGTVPIGRSIPGRQVVLLDSADRPCPSGVSGQIVVRTPYVTPGYLGEDAAGRAAFRPVSGLQGLGRGNSVNEVGWYRTGDLGRLRWDGTLEFCGRQDKLVKFQGRRIELEDIEATLATQESLSDCAVIPVAGADGLVHRLVAYVVPSGADGPEAGLAAQAAQWRRSLRRAFGDSMLPVSFTTVASLPRNLGGKVDRRMLADRVPESASAPTMPRTPAQVRLAGIWAELTGARCPGVDDNFFAAGGHSMLMLTLLDRIRVNFGVELPLWECCVNPTIAGIAALVESAQSTRNSVREVIG